MDYTNFNRETEGRWANIFSGLFEFRNAPNPSGWIQCKSPLRQEKTPSFSFNVNNGWCKDFTTGEAMSGIDLLMSLIGSQSRAEAMKYALDSVGRSRPMLTEKKSNMASFIQKVWAEAIPISVDDSSWRYLTGRGIEKNLATRAKCRTHHGLKLFDHNREVLGTYSAMIFQYFRYIQTNIVDTDGVLSGTQWTPDWSGIHVTYIGKDFKKAPHDNVKKMFQISGLAGSVIPILAGDKSYMVISEGIENALAWESINNTDATIVAAGSTSIMKSFRVTDNLMDRVNHFTILGDLDANYAGQAAAFQAAHNIAVRGKTVDVQIPQINSPHLTHTKGIDWADIL